ncbi:MAG TPA: tetratricopeptide repeat protein [Terriglobales bacterium]|nr:tetratricopeptide repeat protein [Terriglobales bacterium]
MKDALFIFLLAYSAMTFAQGPGPSGPGPGAPAVAGDGVNGSAVGSLQVVNVSGVVRLQDGSVHSESIAILSDCAGHINKEAYSDGKGHFTFNLRDRLATTKPGGTNPVTDPTRTLTHHLTAECTISAELTGYQSSTINLSTFHLGDRSGNVEVGTITLTRSTSVQGTAVSALDANAPKNAHKDYDKARELLDHGKADEAKKLLQKAVEAYPQFAGAWVLLGHADMALNQVEDGRTAYQKAISADPNYVPPYVFLAQVAVVQQKWDDAAKYSQQAIALDDQNFPAAYFYLAGAKYNVGKADEALEAAMKGIAVDHANSTPRLHLLAGQIYSLQGESAKAAEQFQAYLRIAPNAPDAAQVRRQLDSLAAK